MQQIAKLICCQSIKQRRDSLTAQQSPRWVACRQQLQIHQFLQTNPKNRPPKYMKRVSVLWHSLEDIVASSLLTPEYPFMEEDKEGQQKSQEWMDTDSNQTTCYTVPCHLHSQPYVMQPVMLLKFCYCPDLVVTCKHVHNSQLRQQNRTWYLW